jgi:hypothetical protein
VGEKRARSCQIPSSTDQLPEIHAQKRQPQQSPSPPALPSPQQPPPQQPPPPPQQQQSGLEPSIFEFQGSASWGMCPSSPLLLDAWDPQDLCRGPLDLLG